MREQCFSNGWVAVAHGMLQMLKREIWETFGCCFRCEQWSFSSVEEGNSRRMCLFLINQYLMNIGCCCEIYTVRFLFQVSIFHCRAAQTYNGMLFS